MKAPKSESNFQNPPIGNHVARCCAIIDLGTQMVKDFKSGADKPARKIRFSWELLNETAVFDEAKGPERFTVHSTFTFSMYKQSALRQMLESWAGKSFTDEQADGLEIEGVLGKSCMVNMTESKDGKYVNVSAVSGVPKGMDAPPMVSQPVLFSLDEPNWEVFDKLTTRTKEKIALSPEYAAAYAAK